MSRSRFTRKNSSFSSQYYRRKFNRQFRFFWRAACRRIPADLAYFEISGEPDYYSSDTQRWFTLFRTVRYNCW